MKHEPETDESKTEGTLAASLSTPEKIERVHERLKRWMEKVQPAELRPTCGTSYPGKSREVGMDPCCLDPDHLGGCVDAKGHRQIKVAESVPRRANPKCAVRWCQKDAIPGFWYCLDHES